MFSDLVLALDSIANVSTLSSKVASQLFAVRKNGMVLNTKLSFKALDELSVMNNEAFSEILNVYAIYMMASMEEKDVTALLLSEHLFEDLEQVFKNELDIFNCKILKEAQIQKRLGDTNTKNAENQKVFVSKSSENLVNIIGMLDECLIDDIPVDFLHYIWEDLIKPYGFEKEQMEFLLSDFHKNNFPEKDVFQLDVSFVQKFFEVKKMIPLIFKKRATDIVYHRGNDNFVEDSSSKHNNSFVYRIDFSTPKDETVKTKPVSSDENNKKVEKSDKNKEIKKNLPVNPLDKER